MSDTLFEVTPTSDALVSEDGLYRYWLTRSWGAGPVATFVMLNPSIADASADDPTIRRCIGFAQSWGYGGVLVGNLFAYRATNPRNLPDGDEAIGPDNNRWLIRLRSWAGLTVAAWGAHHRIIGRAAEVMDLLGGLHVLRLTKQGNPGHPLYVPAATQPTRWTHA